MEFQQYQQIPIIVEAVQWDGTANGANLIADFLMHHYRSADVVVHHRRRNGSPAEIWLEFEKGPHKLAGRMESRDWLLKDKNGAQILTNASFLQLYTPRRSSV